MAATPFGQFWPSSWSTDSLLNAASITASASQASNAITNSVASPNEVLDTEVGISVLYGGTITGGGVLVSVCRKVDGTNFESSVADSPFTFVMPVVASTTCRKALTIRGASAGDFKIVITNRATNSTVTATLTYRQSQGQSG